MQPTVVSRGKTKSVRFDGNSNNENAEPTGIKAVIKYFIKRKEFLKLVVQRIKLLIFISEPKKGRMEEQWRAKGENMNNKKEKREIGSQNFCS